MEFRNRLLHTYEQTLTNFRTSLVNDGHRSFSPVEDSVGIKEVSDLILHRI
jgi:hypothetical protein